MKAFLYLILAALFPLFSYAQDGDFTFAKPTQAEFDMLRYAKDTTADAVVLREFGTAYISTSMGLSLIFEHHVRIKIFNEKGLNHGNISIALRKNNANVFEKISDVEGITFYPDEQGLIRTASLDPKQVFKENKSKYRDLAKFAMPNVRKGSIIEYKYRIESPFIYQFWGWQFQSDIPKIYSEYLARIPAVFNYNVSLRGPYKLTKNSGKVERECYNGGGGFKADCSAMTYAMADVPAFIEEDNMTSAQNFLSAMSFELSDYVDPYGVKHKVTQEWSSIDRELKTNEDFGSQLKKKDFFKEKLASLTAAIPDPLQKAKTIYQYLHQWYKWDHIIGTYAEYGVKKAYETHTGNVADINIGLTAALLSAGLDAEVVLLSTRDNGFVNKLFPVTSDFNYVVSKVNINGESYLLDATEPLLPFGLLPIRCINDQGRVMSLSKPSYWIDLKASQKDTKTYSVQLALNDNGTLSGKISFISSGYAAYNKRTAMKKSSSLDEYVEKLEEKWPKMKILKFDISNVDSLEKPVTEVYDVEIKAYDDLKKDRIFLNPFLLDRTSENPFKLAERLYPVDMGAASETRVLMQLNFPAGFEVQSKPEAIGLALPNKGGKFMMQVNQDDNVLSLYQLTQLDKSIYQPEEYLFLKELFNKIVLTQKSDIVLKKNIH